MKKISHFRLNKTSELSDLETTAVCLTLSQEEPHLHKRCSRAALLRDKHLPICEAILEKGNETADRHRGCTHTQPKHQMSRVWASIDRTAGHHGKELWSSSQRLMYWQPNLLGSSQYINIYWMHITQTSAVVQIVKMQQYIQLQSSVHCLF